MEAFSEREDNFTVWSSVNNCLAKLDSLLAYAEDCEANFKLYARALMRNIHAKLGWDPKEGESKYLGGTVEDYSKIPTHKMQGFFLYESFIVMQFYYLFF